MLVCRVRPRGNGLRAAALSRHGPAGLRPEDPASHPIHGIDVSKWNGDIDWRQVRAAGVSFAFIKATEGKDNIDNRFHDNWRAAKAAGVPPAPYHFYYFCSTADQQADWFIANVPKASMVLPPVLDVEWNGESKNCRYRPSKLTAVQELQRFLNRLEAHYGKRPIIYTTVDFHRDILVGEFKNYHFWLRAVADHPNNIYNRSSLGFLAIHQHRPHSRHQGRHRHQRLRRLQKELAQLADRRRRNVILAVRPALSRRS